MLHGVELEYKDLCERGGATLRAAVTHLTNMYKDIMTLMGEEAVSKGEGKSRHLRCKCH